MPEFPPFKYTMKEVRQAGEALSQKTHLDRRDGGIYPPHLRNCTQLARLARLSAPPKRRVEMLDISAWWAETEKLLPMRRDLHRAMLLTGARRSSILTVRRSDIDLDRKVLTFQHMKIGPPMKLPMGELLTEMLRKRLEDDLPLGSEWLWPSATSGRGHIVDPRARGHEQLPSAHEYRHIARTLFIASGAPYAESALLLGQKLPRGFWRLR